MPGKRLTRDAKRGGEGSGPRPGTISPIALLAVGLFATGLCGNAPAASCCGGGASGSLLLPKTSEAMIDVSVDGEHYNGFWKGDGDWSPDPPGAALHQYRLNLGYAQRLAPRWQLSASLPYVWNNNRYANLERSTHGIGDGVVSMWYEAFDDITCVWNVTGWQDLKPAIYWGASLLLPTGTSPYDEVQDSFDITGRGAYRLDGSVLIEKTIYPWSATLQASYGRYLERPVNREYGQYVEPYDKQLGDRFSRSLALGYTYFTDRMDSLTATLTYAHLTEQQTRFDGHTDPTSGLQRRSLTASLAWATEDRRWVSRLSWNHAPARDGWGENFPVTDIISLGVSHVLR